VVSDRGQTKDLYCNRSTVVISDRGRTKDSYRNRSTAVISDSGRTQYFIIIGVQLLMIEVEPRTCIAIGVQ